MLSSIYLPKETSELVAVHKDELERAFQGMKALRDGLSHQVPEVQVGAFMQMFGDAMIITEVLKDTHRLWKLQELERG
jgi:hypothetical protein